MYLVEDWIFFQVGRQIPVKEKEANLDQNCRIYSSTYLDCNMLSLCAHKCLIASVISLDNL